MKRHFKTLTMVMTCMAMALCVSCKKDNNNEPNTNSGGTIAGHEYIDLGLPSGTLWATCNVGADKPEDYGNYFAWGETETKSTYDWNTYKWCRGSYDNLTKYNTKPGYGRMDGKKVLALEDDAAHVNWGENWRMPTLAEMEELKNWCTWTWVDDFKANRKVGYKVTARNGNSIFLPYASLKYYWSSSLNADKPCNAYYLYLGSSIYFTSDGDRYMGHLVRPVCRPQ